MYLPICKYANVQYNIVKTWDLAVATTMENVC